MKTYGGKQPDGLPRGGVKEGPIRKDITVMTREGQHQPCTATEGQASGTQRQSSAFEVDTFGGLTGKQKLGPRRQRQL